MKVPSMVCAAAAATVRWVSMDRMSGVYLIGYL